MTYRSRRFISQRAGSVLAAIAVVSMSVCDHQVIADAQHDHWVGVLAVGSASTTSSKRHVQPVRVIKVAFDGMGPNVAHHYP